MLRFAVAAIARPTGTNIKPDNFSNQVIASVGLNNGAASSNATANEQSDATEDLSPETQAFVNAIVQQLGGN